MAFKQSWVEEWLASVAPGERYVSHLVVATWKGVRVTGVHKAGFSDGLRAEVLKLKGEAALAQRIDQLQLDPDRAVGMLVDAGFLALTDRRLIFGSRSALRNRPKDLVHAGPAGAALVHWFDHDETAGNRFRHLVIEFGDGTWKTDRTGLTVLGKDVSGTANAAAFFDALGPRGVPLEA